MFRILLMTVYLCVFLLTCYMQLEAGEDKEADKLIEEAKKLAAKPSERELSTQSERTLNLNEFNPRLTVFGDFLGRIDNPDSFNHDGDNISDRFSMKGVELDLRADVDPFSKAVAIIGFHEHGPGEVHIHAEEAYLTLETLPCNLHMKMGKFLSGFGQINKTHEHDLPWTTKPRVMEQFFSGHGLVTTGANLSFLFPKQPLQLDIEVTNGENHAILAGNDSRNLAYVGRLKYSIELGKSHFLEIGTSQLFGYNDADGKNYAAVTGFDFLYKWKPLRSGLYNSFVFQGEFLSANIEKNTTAASMQPSGAYAMLQYQIDKHWYAGVRYDWFEFVTDDTTSQQGGGVYISYYTTEFIRFRVGYERHEDTLKNIENTFYFQLTFVFGSHPAEPYWVNR
ncbi:MAG: TonB-dependent receptor [Planctomycetota bacterium]